MKWLDRLIKKRVDKIQEEIYKLEERRDNYKDELDRENEAEIINKNLSDFYRKNFQYVRLLVDTIDCIQEEIEKKKKKIRFINQLFFIKT